MARAVLRTLRDRISVQDSPDCTLPFVLKAISVDGWKCPEQPNNLRTIKEFAVEVRM